MLTISNVHSWLITVPFESIKAILLILVGGRAVILFSHLTLGLELLFQVLLEVEQILGLRNILIISPRGRHHLVLKRLHILWERWWLVPPLLLQLRWWIIRPLPWSLIILDIQTLEHIGASFHQRVPWRGHQPKASNVAKSVIRWRLRPCIKKARVLLEKFRHLFYF